MTDAMNQEPFLDALRTALNHLYDPDYLRRSPLAARFGVADRLDTPAALQRILTSAIESLRPPPAAPINRQNQRLYDILLYRYVQQSTQEEVAHQLATSPRQLRREQTAAIEMLACVLSEQYGVESVPGSSDEPSAVLPADDLAWLKEQPLDGATDLPVVLDGVLALLRRLATERRIAFEVRLADGLQALAVHRMALRQMLLSLLDAAVQGAVGPIIIQAARAEGQIVIEVRHAVADSSDSSASCSSLAMAARLAQLSGGHLSVSDAAASRTVSLILPAAQSIKVLAIDDNSDLLRLLERFLEGTRYRLVGSRNPLAVFDLIEREAAQVILMDAMMPDLDGWEMLGRLRAHPQSANIPVVICTILDQERLALSLGATRFLRKPVTREALLVALDSCISDAPAQVR